MVNEFFPQKHSTPTLTSSQGLQGPGWHCIVHLCEHFSCLRQGSPQECGTRYRLKGTSSTFEQKQLGSGKSLVAFWQPGHLQLRDDDDVELEPEPEFSCDDDFRLHSCIHLMWNIAKQLDVQLQILLVGLILSKQIIHSYVEFVILFVSDDSKSRSSTWSTGAVPGFLLFLDEGVWFEGAGAFLWPALFNDDSMPLIEDDDEDEFPLKLKARPFFSLLPGIVLLLLLLVESEVNVDVCDCVKDCGEVWFCANSLSGFWFAASSMWEDPLANVSYPFFFLCRDLLLVGLFVLVMAEEFELWDMLDFCIEFAIWELLEHDNDDSVGMFDTSDDIEITVAVVATAGSRER
jgi:hypothetical protein